MEIATGEGIFQKRAMDSMDMGRVQETGLLSATV